MKANLFNQMGDKGVYFNTHNFESRKTTKFKSIFDATTDSTVIIVNFDRAAVNESKDFYEYIQELIFDNKTNIILDLENVYFMDSVFFGTMIKLLKRVKKDGGNIKLIVDHVKKPELLSISNFEGIFNTYSNLFDALNTNKAS